VAAERVVARLAPHLGRLSCVVVVTPAWDEGALGERIRGAGVACTTLVVGGAAVRGPGVRAVPVEAIEQGEGLAL
jgi:hypothetical protein